MEHSSPYSIDIIMAHKPWRQKDSTSLITDVAARTLEHLHISQSVEFCVKLTSDSEVQRLNRIYRGKDEPTNVLSFPTHTNLIDIIMAHKPWRQKDSTSLITDVAARTLEHLHISQSVEFCVKLTSDSEVQRLNRIYRGKDEPTNVLSFPTHTNLKEIVTTIQAPLLLGDIVLAFETVETEAQAQEKNFNDHLMHLVVHGLLHLLGYDHESEPDAHKMELLESEILALFNIKDPYKNHEL